MPRPTIKELQASARAHVDAVCAQLTRLAKRADAAAAAPPPVRKDAEVVLFHAPRPTPPTPIREAAPGRTAEEDLMREAQRLVDHGDCPDLSTAVERVCKEYPRIYRQHCEERREAQRVRDQAPSAPVPVRKDTTQPRPLLHYELLVAEMKRTHPDWSTATCEQALKGTVEGRRALDAYAWAQRYGAI